MRTLHLVSFCALSLSSIATVHASTPGIAEKYETFNNALEERYDLEYADRLALIARNYNALFSPPYAADEVTAVSDSDLSLLFRAADDAAFYTNDERYIRDMAFYLTEMKQRGTAKASDRTQMYGAYIGARDFARAAAYLEENSDLELHPLPQYRELADLPGEPTILRVDGENALSRTAFELDVPARIVVVSHPLCHFTRDAIDSIRATPEVDDAFRDALWLAPQDRKLNLDVIHAWNEQYPDKRVSIAFHQEEWPAVTSWATPSFYFFQDGKLVATVIGWPAEGNMAEVKAALRKIGLL